MRLKIIFISKKQVTGDDGRTRDDESKARKICLRRSKVSFIARRRFDGVSPMFVLWVSWDLLWTSGLPEGFIEVISGGGRLGTGW